MSLVYLNHLLIFVDIDTYRAISASDFLNRHLAWSEERTTRDEATGMSWTGCYFYGHHTYFEFMNPEATSWAPRDGIAFGVDEENADISVERALREQVHQKVRRYARTRKDNDRDIPWFDAVELPRPDDHHLITWLMAYHPDFLRRWAPELPPETIGVARKQILTRYRHRVGETDDASRLFEDITSVTISLPPEEAALLQSELTAYGFSLEKSGGEIIYEGNAVRLIIQRRAELPAGIRAFTMKTAPVSEPVTCTFSATCRLTVHTNGEAEWRMW